MRIGPMPNEIKHKIFELTLAVYRVTDIFPRNEILKFQIREKANEIMSSVYEYSVAENGHHLSKIKQKVDTLRSFLTLARFTRVVKAINIAVLDREYEFIASFLDSRSYGDFEGSSPEKLNPEFNNKSPQMNKANKVNSRTRSEVSLEKTFDTESASIMADKGTAFGEKGEVAPIRPANGNGQNHFNERQQTILDYIKTNQAVKSNDLAAIFANKFNIKTLQRDLTSLMNMNVIEKEGDKRWAVYKAKA